MIINSPASDKNKIIAAAKLFMKLSSQKSQTYTIGMMPAKLKTVEKNDAITRFSNL